MDPWVKPEDDKSEPRMLRLLLFRFWPVLIPLMVYWLWFRYVGRKATIDGKPALRFRDGPWYWLVFVSLLVGVVCFVFWGATREAAKGAYIPAHMEKGSLIPGHVEPLK